MIIKIICTLGIVIGLVYSLWEILPRNLSEKMKIKAASGYIPKDIKKRERLFYVLLGVTILALILIVHFSVEAIMAS